MSEALTHQVTKLLVEWSGGDEEALDALTPLVYGELRRLAASYMKRERPDHTLQSTALVHEAYMRLIDQRVGWKSRGHFFAMAAQMMRRILVDYAKAHGTAKRGAKVVKLSVDESPGVSQPSDIDLVSLDQALRDLAGIDPLRSRIVELRYFGGLTNEECANVLGVSPATVQRQWAGARAWLARELRRTRER